jgi:cytochrome c biogenesis protein CcmG/thiol:disulfide interchange protein DsbE
MTGRQQWAAVGVIVGLMAVGLLAASHFLKDELQQVTIGSQAPQFSAITIDDKPRIKTLDAFKGQVVLVNVWGTWCVPCRVEMPSIDSLYQQLAPKGLKIVAVAVDQSDGGPSQMKDIRDFVKQYHLNFDVLYDTSGAIQTQYRTTGVPESFVVARDGTIRRKFIGADNWNSEDNRKLFELLLAEPAK